MDGIQNTPKMKLSPCPTYFMLPLARGMGMGWDPDKIPYQINKNYVYFSGDHMF